MLTITYHATEADRAVEGGVLFGGQGLPDWMNEMRDPDHSSPIELWAPIAGDRQHVVHVTGTVSYWHVRPEDVERLISDVERLAQFRTFLEQHPPDRFQWIVRAESRNHQRVPRSDEDYQRQLRATFDA